MHDRHTTDSAALLCLYAIGLRCVDTGDLNALCQGLIAASCETTHAAGGDLQLVDPVTGRLTIMAHQGLPVAFIEAVNGGGGGHTASAGALAEWGRGGATGAGSTGHDSQWPIPANTDTGLAVMESTLLFSPEGHVLGVLSLYSAGQGQPTFDQSRRVDALAQVAGECIAAHRRFENLRGAYARERAERIEAQEADRTKSELLATLAHELLQPVTALFPALEVRKVSADAERRARADGVIDAQLTHMVRLITDLSDAAKLTRGALALRCDRMDLRVAVQEAVELAQNRFERRGHRLNVTIADAPIWIFGDRMRLKQVFANLLQNAATYTPDRGTVTASVVATDDHAVFRLHDTGIGIAPDALERIFRLFERGASDSLAVNLGVGLALVRSLVELHGGTVTAFSEGLNRGSEFVVTLPLLP